MDCTCRDRFNHTADSMLRAHARDRAEEHLDTDIGARCMDYVRGVADWCVSVALDYCEPTDECPNCGTSLSSHTTEERLGCAAYCPEILGVR